jgi:hypothetical protein
MGIFRVHVLVAKGSARLEDAGVLHTGDDARLTGAGSRSLTAESNGAEILIGRVSVPLCLLTAVSSRLS